MHLWRIGKMDKEMYAQIILLHILTQTTQGIPYNEVIEGIVYNLEKYAEQEINKTIERDYPDVASLVNRLGAKR